MNLLTKILNQRPEDPLSILETLNRNTQWEWFHPKLDTLRDDPEMQPTYEMAEKQKALFGRGGGEGEQEMEEEVVSELVWRGGGAGESGGGGRGTDWPTPRHSRLRVQTEVTGNTVSAVPGEGSTRSSVWDTTQGLGARDRHWLCLLETAPWLSREGARSPIS